MMIAKGPGCLFIAWTEDGSIYTHCLLEDGTLGAPINALLVPSEYATIQAAFDSADDGDMILVADGTYVENINFNGKNITVVSTDGPEATVIDGDQNGSVVTLSNGEDETAVLTGFTIQNGSAQYGAGVVSQYSGPTLSDLIVQNNVAADNGYSGGGVNFYNSTGRLLNSVVRDNHSNGTGGGVFIAHGTVQVTNTPPPVPFEWLSLTTEFSNLPVEL
jgi:hypothetical protein